MYTRLNARNGCIGETDKSYDGSSNFHWDEFIGGCDELELLIRKENWTVDGEIITHYYLANVCRVKI
jgi:hypothetical protein